MSIAWRACFAVLVLLSAGRAGAESNYKPTQEEVAAVDARTEAYFQAMARADYARAYAMLAPGMQAQFTPARWDHLGAQFRALRGERYTRKRTAMTWMLDPPDAAGPGLYAIIDFQGRSDNLAALAEYLVWYRAPGEADFRLLRHEQDAGAKPASPTNATGTTPATAATSTPAPLAEVAHDGAGIGYATVAEARAALASRPGATTHDSPEGWHIVVEQSPTTVWSFVPAGHPAFPSVVRRVVAERDGGSYIDMSVLCEADKPACDSLVREFQAMNRKTADEGR